MKALPTYPAYKPTAIPWLPQVPEHWEVKPGLAHLRFKQVKNTGMVEKRVLSLSYGRIVIKPQEKLTGLVPESFETYQIVDPGDIIIRATDLQNDRTSLRVGEVKDRGIITSAYLCLNVHDGMVPAFGYHLIHAYDLMKWLYGYGSGLRQNLDWGDFKRMPLIVPPLEEQHLIVRYLRALDAKVKRYIRTKRKLIAALQEQKQAIIQRAVTRGLDPNVKLKPSGVEWLGEVPEHWEVVRFKRLLKRIEQGVSPQAEAYLAEGNAWGVLKAGCVNRGVFRETEHKRLPNGYEVDESLQVKAGDVLISRASGSPSLVGSVGLVEQVNRRLILSDKTFRPVFRAERIKRFCVAAMNTPYFRHQVEQAISGAEGLANNLPLTSLKDFSLVVPPEAEAERIAKSLSRDTQQFDIGLRALEGDINLMQEYHTRLIADVVTGAVDVREAARKLPEEDQMIRQLEDQTMEEEPLTMAAEGEAEYGEPEER